MLLRLRATALIALLIGAVGSLGFMFLAGRRTPPILIALFLLWDLSPFVLLVWADRMSARWAAPTRATLYGVMLVVTLGSLVAYGTSALRPPRAQGAYWFVLIPPASWLLTAAAIPIAAFVSRRRAG